MENKIYEQIMNEFIIYRMEEELNLLDNLIENNNKKIKNKKKWNLNFIYNSKKEALKKEYDYKLKEYDKFINEIGSENRINESEFNNKLDDVFKNDATQIKRYSFFLQSYFIYLYSDSSYIERNRIDSLNDIILELDLNVELNFINKSIRKNIRKIEGKNILNLLNNLKMNIDGQYLFPFAYNSLSKMLDLKGKKSKTGLLEDIIKSDRLNSIIPENKNINEIDYEELKVHLFMYLILEDYLSEYAYKDEKITKLLISSFLKLKNEYEKFICNNKEFDIEKEDKLNLLNRVLLEINS